MENDGEDSFGLTEDQMRKIEEKYKDKASRIEHKKSIDKRGSIKLKNISKECSSFNRDEMNTVEAWANFLENVEANLEAIDEFCQKKRIHFLNELKLKLPSDQFKSFLSSLQLYKVPQGGKLQEQGKPHNYHYVIVQGCIGAFRQKKSKQEEKEYIEAFQYEIGEFLISNTLQTHKSNPYTIKSKRLSLLLRFSEQTYCRYLKKICTKEFDELASTLSHHLLFRGISVLEIKKYLPYCSFKRFRYNELVYQEEDRIRHLFLILQGQAQISYDREDKSSTKQGKTILAPLITPNLYKLNHQSKEKKQIKIVRVGKREIFGLQAAEIYMENYYQHHVRVTSDALKTLAMGLEVLYDMEMQNPLLEENIQAYLKKVTNMHVKLLEKYQSVSIVPQKKKRRKRKIKRKAEISLQWWGLAEKLQGSKKYRLPTPPKSQSQQNLTRKQPLMLQNRTSKLDYFKRRLFEQQMEGLEQIDEKENDSQLPPAGLIPRLQKVKIKMINAKPKVINNAQRIKRRLMQYAKNDEIFCDKLQLE